MPVENTSLVRIIGRAMHQARQDGLDQLGQVERAVRSVLNVEPDLSDRAARRMVETLRAD